MISDYRCFYCFVRAFGKILEKEPISSEKKESFTVDMVKFYLDKRGNLTGPLFSRELHKMLQSYTRNTDPFREEKKHYNDKALGMMPGLERIILESEERFDTALRLAIAGNIIDFAANSKFDLEATIEKALKSDFAINHSRELKEKLKSARSVLYLGDNAGEIVFDRLFIETLNHPDLTYAVRGSPVINDATMEDAEYTGLTSVVKVISNGYDAPSTIPEKSSGEFRKYFNEADLIISKGQGNLEGLLPLNDPRIFFLLMVKCNVMAEFLKVEKGSLVVFNRSFL